MTSPLDAIVRALDALDVAGGGREPSSLTTAELMAVTAAFGHLRRRVEAAFAPVAAEVARQSRTELGKESLARRQGFRTPVSLIATATGSTAGEAARLVKVGEATAPPIGVSGERRPSRHPHVAEGLQSGSLGTWAASQIVALVDRLHGTVDATRLDTAERALVTSAAQLRPDEVSRLLERAEAQLDPDGITRRERERHADRGLVLQQRDGMTHLTAVLDTETAAPVRAAIEGLTTAALRRNEHADDAERDQRSVKQIQADALADLCRHALGCQAVPTLATTTVVVRIDLDALTSGEGAGSIDGSDTPVSAGAVRRLAADAQVIPCVLGGDSEILDWGRTKRLFTPAQKLALAERDGGCAG